MHFQESLSYLSPHTIIIPPIVFLFEPALERAFQMPIFEHRIQSLTQTDLKYCHN